MAEAIAIIALVIVGLVLLVAALDLGAMLMSIPVAMFAATRDYRMHHPHHHRHALG